MRSHCSWKSQARDLIVQKLGLYGSNDWGMAEGCRGVKGVPATGDGGVVGATEFTDAYFSVRESLYAGLPTRNT